MEKIYIASCSFGKDSIATILLALEHGEPLDRVVFCEVMFDHARGISGEWPEHIEWVYNVAIPKLQQMGVVVDIVRSERDYIGEFVDVYKRGQYVGKMHGFPIAGRCAINKLKVRPIQKYYKEQEFEKNVIQYIGIAVDEPKRLARIKGNKVSLLAKYNYTEADAMAKCAQYGLVSPLYKKNKRGGCWFCMNQSVEGFCELRRLYPALWGELKKLDEYKNRVSTFFKYNKTLQELEAEMDKKDFLKRNQLCLF